MYDLSNYTPHELAANTIRTLAMDAVQAAESGHPGTPMGLADVAVVLWKHYLKHNPADPQWPDRDRFVLSAGHASMLIYSLLHLSGYDLSLQELKNFRQWGSHTPGHPENFKTEGVETTTGPLGQGLGNAVGMALAERWLAAQFNRPGYDVVDHYTYVIASDGDLMEGVSHESASLAGHLGLGKLIVFFDDNEITIDGSTELAWSDDVLGRFQAYQWHTQAVDGHDVEAITAAIDAAHAEGERPSLIAVRTHIGYGSPHKQGTASAHGEPLGEEEIRLTKKTLGWPEEATFYVPQEARDYLRPAEAEGWQAQWQKTFEAYEEAHPELAQSLQAAWRGESPKGWDQDLPAFEAGKKLATRAASGQILDGLLPHIPWMLGGSADLTGSNKTKAGGITHLTRDDFSGRYIHYGIREHGMGAAMNGMVLHGGLRPYGGTFLIFSDYMRPTIRLAAMMGLPVIYVFTHDSIGLGEDGPTHQPIEQLPSLRAIPNLVTFRPADATETTVGWRVALQRREGPTALVLTRQKLETLDRAPDGGRYAPAEEAARGAYVISDADDARAILIGTGSEVHLALAAQELLAQEGVAARVVSMPSWELFAAQPKAYRHSVLPPAITARVAVEAAARLGWERYVGDNGCVVGLDRFGASAPYEEIYEQLGLTAQAVAEAALALLG
ncbi:MAG TPA: transketolase [Candidatus Sulfomarinibacteraceae bacterium]|nr:transketolase [Candidatus Sulfomarinibacteraceae bacterium]